MVLCLWRGCSIYVVLTLVNMNGGIYRLDELCSVAVNPPLITQDSSRQETADNQSELQEILASESWSPLDELREWLEQRWGHSSREIVEDITAQLHYSHSVAVTYWSQAIELRLEQLKRNPLADLGLKQLVLADHQAYDLLDKVYQILKTQPIDPSVIVKRLEKLGDYVFEKVFELVADDSLGSGFTKPSISSMASSPWRKP